MTQTTDPTTAAVPPAGAEGIRESLRGKYVCPFCGSVNDNEQGTCPRCTMENSAATRKATKTRIGPWYVLQTRNPAAPGMTWETLIGFIRKGRVKPRSIVRGPTTHQLWRFAAHVKGLSREFGICYSCGSNVEPTANLCPQCNRLQDPPPNPDALLEASREAQQTYTTPPATIDGTVLAGTSTVSTTVGAVAASVAPPPPPPPDDAEFVIPALGGFMGLEAGGSHTGATPATKSAEAAAHSPTASTNGPSSGAAAAASSAAARAAAHHPAPHAEAPPGVTPASAGPTTPPNHFQGLTGDTSWARIGTGVPTDPSRARGGAANAGVPRPPPRTNGAANSGAPKFNPYADDDLPQPPGRRGAAGGEGEGFLSAKDLAAAFNLGFVGEEEEEDPRAAAAAARGGRAARGRNAAREQAAMSGFPGFGTPAYKVPSGRSKLKITLAILGLLVMGLGMALAVSSDFRQAVKKVFNSLTSGLNKQGEGDQLGSPGSTNSKSENSPRHHPAPPEPPAKHGNSTNPAEAETEPAAPASATRPAEVPATRPVSLATPPGVPTPPATPPPPATRPTLPPIGDHTIPATVPSTVPPPAPVTGTSWAQSEAAKLYREGVSMENADPALAMSRYKEIQRRFPPETWPTDLDTRIKRLGERLKKLYGG